MTDELVAFLKACLDKDEAAARQASARALQWPARGTWHLEGVEYNVVGDEEAFCHPHNAAHIVRHDPARVLREIEAKRRMIETFTRRYEASKPGKAEGAHWVMLSDTLRLLALPYADHPDYREEWRP